MILFILGIVLFISIQKNEQNTSAGCAFCLFLMFFIFKISFSFYLNYLEKYINGSWQPYTSWSHSDATNVNSSDSISVSSGTYRVWMTVTTQGFLGCEEFDVNGNVAGC